MGRRDSLIARCVAETCLHVVDVVGGHFSGCPFFRDCPRGDEMPNETCFEEILAWMNETDPASELGPGELRAVEKRTPEGYPDHSDLKATLHHYSELLSRLAQAVPLPGAPSYAECVDKAIEIIENWKVLNGED